ncbi:MAG: hypothetical protein AB1941_05805 [Gemmatimonadota bacterium]
MHLCAEGKARPLGIVVTAGQRNDATQLEPVLDFIHVPQRRGPARKRPKRLRLDRADGARKYRKVLRKRRIPCICPERKDAQKAPGQGIARRTPSCPGCRSVQGQKRGRALHQPAQGLPRRGDSLRQARAQLLGRCPRRFNHALALIFVRHTLVDNRRGVPWSSRDHQVRQPC